MRAVWITKFFTIYCGGVATSILIFLKLEKNYNEQKYWNANGVGYGFYTWKAKTLYEQTYIQNWAYAGGVPPDCSACARKRIPINNIASIGQKDTVVNAYSYIK